MEAGDIIRRFHAAKSQRTTVQTDWDVIERFVAPYRGRMFKDQTNEHAIEWRKRELYDSTAVNSAQTLAASLHGSLTSPSTKWFSLAYRTEELNDDNTAKEWLEDCGKRVYNALQDSNFNLEANELYMDLTTFGTGCIMCEPIEARAGEFTGLEFTAVPVKECFFEPGNRGVHTFFRCMKWEPSRIVDKFGDENVPQLVHDRLEQANPDKLEVLFCIYPRKRHKNADTSKALAPSRRPYGFKYILVDSKEQIGKEGGYYEMPVYIPRWRKVSESIWGHSPANVALGDILTANQLVEMQLKSAEKLIDPPMMVTERALIGDLELKAGGLTVLRDINELVPLQTGAVPSVGDVRLDDLRQAIRQYFFVDELELKESPAMTATEVQVRYEIMQRLLGPTLGRLQSDFLDPVVERVFNILYRSGRLPQPPEVVIENQAEMDVNYMGPLSRAQRADQVTAVERWMMLLGSQAELYPELLDTPDVDEIAKGTAAMLSVPAKFLRSAEEVAANRQEREEMMQRQQEAMVAEQEGKAMGAQAEAEQAQGAA